MLRLLIVLTVLLEVNLKSLQNGSCSLNFPIQNDQDEPVLLTVNEEDEYELAIPQNGKFSFQPNQELVLFCPNARNSLVEVNKNVATASCVRNEIFKVSNQQYEFENLRCKKSVKGDVKATNERCGNNVGNIIDIGFQVTKSDWISLIQVCYDSQQANTLYTEHIIYGQSIMQASKQNKRPPFQSNEVPKGISPNSVYTQSSQLVTFTKLLGSQKLANEYIRQTTYLARGHLSPDADFLFAPLQFATYFYINTCPQWSNINSGNWKSLESMLRKAAGKRGEPLKIITGTHEVLELPDVDDNLVTISLDARGMLPVPKFIWKIAYSESTRQGIAFVSVNNPYIEDLSDDLTLCQDVCSRYNWISDKWGVADKGIIYCCDIRELQKTVRTIPKISVSGILRG